MKIWHGNEYNTRGEEQLLGYLDDYHLDRGYMLSFNFNKKPGVQELHFKAHTLIEAVVQIEAVLTIGTEAHLS